MDCNHLDAVRIYDSSAHIEYGCTSFGFTHTNKEVLRRKYSDIDEAAFILLGIALIIFIAGAFEHQKLWRRVFDLTILMILCQSRAVDYTLVYFVPAAVLMMMEEESVTKLNVLPIVMLMLLVVAYPTTYIHGSRYLTLSHSDIVQMVCMIMLLYEGVSFGSGFVGYLREAHI